MNLEKQLPYLGEKQEDGTFLVCGIRVNRPDYKAFVSGSEYKSIADCIAILIGIANINDITKICKDELVTTYANEIHLHSGIDKNRWNSMSHSLREKIISINKKAFFLELVGNYKYKVLPEDENGKETFYLHHILKDLFECMYSGIKNGDLKLIPGLDYQLELDNDFDCLFSENYFSYQRGSFLKWAKNNGYKIPDEIIFLNKNDSNEIVVNSLKLYKKINTIEKLHDFLLKARQEADLFYEALKREVRLDKRKLSSVGQEDIEMVFSKTKSQYDILDKDDITPDLSEYNSIARDIKGKLIFNMVNRGTQVSQSIKEQVGWSYQTLYPVTTQLIKKS